MPDETVVELPAFPPRTPLPDPPLRNSLQFARVKTNTELDDSEIVSGARWGHIVGTIGDQSDLASVFAGKQNALGYIPLNPAANLSELIDTAIARANLGLGSMAEQDQETVLITGGSISGLTEFKRGIRTVDADADVVSSDTVILADATAADIVLTLPAASLMIGQEKKFKKIDSTANLVTIAADGSETIDGGAVTILMSQYDTITIISDGDNWYVV